MKIYASKTRIPNFARIEIERVYVASTNSQEPVRKVEKVSPLYLNNHLQARPQSREEKPQLRQLNPKTGDNIDLYG